MARFMAGTHPNYLVIRLSSIGDIVHALPAVSALGETYPWARITWVVEDEYASLLEGNPFVRRVITVDTLGWRKYLRTIDTYQHMLYCLRCLRDTVFDAVIDFQGLVKSGVIARLCRSRARVGFARPWLKEPAAGIFYNRRVRAEGSKHAIEENLALAGSLGAKPGAWQFPLPRLPGYEEYLDNMFAHAGVKEFAIINPGGGWIAKRWPPSHYAQLIRRLDPLFAGHFILTGSASEGKEINKIVRASGSSRAYYFPTSIEQFIALARKARLFVGGDTGPLHLAAALGVPIVGLYGPTDPARNGPFSRSDIVLSTHEPINHTRRNKDAGFIEGISVADVVEAVRRRLARANEQ
jgi:heptosyltransferase-1